MPNTDAYAIGDTYPNADCDPHGYTRINTDPYAHAYSYSYSDGDPNAHSNADPYTVSIGYALSGL